MFLNAKNMDRQRLFCGIRIVVRPFSARGALLVGQRALAR